MNDTKISNNIKNNNIIHKNNVNQSEYKKETFSVANKLYHATLSNEGGGTFINTRLIEKTDDLYIYPQKIFF